MAAIISASSSTIIIISILGVTSIFLIFTISCLTLLLRRIARMISLYTFPHIGLHSRKSERQWPQRREMKVPKGTYSKIIQGIENLYQLPNVLLPPSVEEMPKITREGVLGWDWEQAKHPRKKIEITQVQSMRFLQGNNLLNLTASYPKLPKPIEDERNPTKPIHFSTHIHLSFRIIIHLLGNDKLDYESERQFIERKLIPGDFKFNDIILRNLCIYEKSKFGGIEIEKREYLEYINNLRKLIKLIGEDIYR